MLHNFYKIKKEDNNILNLKIKYILTNNLEKHI